MLCPKCGKEVHHSATMCEYCGSELNPAGAPVAVAEKKENMVAGIVGALLGSLLGAASIVLFDQLGYVAALSGLILAICTLKGYELLGGKLSTKGVIICIVLMLIVPYFANQASTAIMFVNEVGSGSLSFAEAYRAVPALISEGGYDVGLYNYTLESGAYYTSLMMIYVFDLIGGLSTIRSALKKK